MLSLLVMWGEDRAELLHYIACDTDEPCSAEEFARHLAEARAEYLEVELAADEVVETRGAFVEDPAADEAVELERYQKLAHAAEEELRQLVKQGRLPARGRGSGLRVNAGGFTTGLSGPSLSVLNGDAGTRSCRRRSCPGDEARGIGYAPRRRPGRAARGTC